MMALHGSPRSNSDVEAARIRVKAFGQQTSAAILNELRAVYAPLVRHREDAVIQVERDVRYGTHERHRLNAFLPNEPSSTGDVLLFVHGGAFVSGDKEEVAGTFYDNIGFWAAHQGITGVIINYRLAPAHRWPAGTEDVACAVNWALDSIAGFNADPRRIFLMGHSAGAAHVAGYLANPNSGPTERPKVAAGILLSGLYDVQLQPVNTAYFGEDESCYASRSPLAGLAKSPVPLLVALAELDPEFIQRQSLSLLNERLATLKSLPQLCQIRGHNHFSTVLHLNSADMSLSRELTSFIRGTTS